MPKTPERRRPRQARSRETYSAIVEAAERILAREGHRGLTTKRVAAIAGVSVGTLYQYFPDRASILHAVEMASYARFVDELKELVTRKTRRRPFLQVASEVVARMVDLLADGTKMHGWMTDPSEKGGRDRAQLRAAASRVLALALEPYEAELYPTDLAIASSVVVGSVINLVRIGLADHPEEMASGRFREEIVALVTRYLVRPTTS